MRKFFGYRDEQLLVLAEPIISHGGERIDALFARFIDNLRNHDWSGRTDDEARELIGVSASLAIDADRDLVAEKNGGLTFVLARICEPAWRLALLGAFSVLRFDARGAREVLKPQSASEELVAKGVGRAEAMDLAGVSTRAAIPGQRPDVDIRVAQVELTTGESVLAIPEPRAFIEVEELRGAPTDVEQIRHLTARLRGPNPQSSRSWFAILEFG